MEKKTTVFCCLKEYNGLRADVLLGKISPLSRSQIENKIKNTKKRMVLNIVKND
mgnify:CR=1 FL=1